MRSVVEIGASVPAFLGKLWKLVNDSETNMLISWSPGGKTFVIKNQADFARELLPLYYKHNNMASFIRQLNMYGFHKITSVENGGLRYEKDEIEFSHPCFMRGHAYLLEHIKRKIANPKAIVASSENGEKILLKPEIMSKVLADVKQMKGKQENLDAKFSAMKQENEALWREVAILRQKHIKQQQIVNNLIQFLMSLVQPTRPSTSTANGVGVKRPYQLMINSAAHNLAGDGNNSSPPKNIKLDKDTDLLEELIEDNLEDGPTIHELAHDDILHNDASQDSLNPINYVRIDVSPSPVVVAGNSPTADPALAQYHVTMEDDLDDAAVTIPNYPSSSPKNKSLRKRTELPASPSPGMPAASPGVPAVSPGLPAAISPDQTVLASPGSSNSKLKSHINGTAPSGKTIQFPNSSPSFQVMNPSADLRLPAEIFASDDSVSDIAASEDTSVQNALQDHIIGINNTKDKMLGGINIKLEKPEVKNPKKSKKNSKDNAENIRLDNVIKTELQDDLDWNIANNMMLATVNNNNDVNKYHSVNRRDNFYKNLEELSSLFGQNGNKQSDIDDHLDSMQTDLESLRELLRSDSYALDTNTLMGLFSADDPFYGLTYNPMEERSKAPNSAKKQKGELSNVSREERRVQDLYTQDDAEGTNQIISYTGNIPDFEDIQMPELEGDSQDACVSPAVVEGGSVLNTPQMVLRSPAYVFKP